MNKISFTIEPSFHAYIILKLVFNSFMNWVNTERI